jgi:glucosamine kinase
MAGGRIEKARDGFKSRGFPFASLEVFDDIDIARAGAHEGEDGAVIIVGTGSAGLGLINGERYQIGGWGFPLGDQMSGAILGRELLRKTLLAHDGIISGSPLTKAVINKFGGDPEQLMAWSFNNPEINRPPRPADYGEFVPMFFEYFERGDAIAEDLMQFELAAIDQYVQWFKDKGTKAIALVGGLGSRLTPLLKQHYGTLLVEPRFEPLHGAVILARQHRQHA